MRKPKIMIIIVSIILLIFFTILLSCGLLYNDDDFSDYTDETIDVSIELAGNPYVIGDIENQIILIAKDYLNEPSLSYVEYKYRSENEIEAMFFCEEKYTGGKYHSNLSIYIDAVNKRISSINYKHGITKRISGFPTAHLQKELNVKEKLSDIAEQSDFSKYKNSYIKLWFQQDDIVAFVINDNRKILWRSN